MALYTIQELTGNNELYGFGVPVILALSFFIISTILKLIKRRGW